MLYFKRLLLLYIVVLAPLLSFAAPPSIRVSLVDTGYDLCVTSQQTNCEKNKNLLFRGSEPLDISDDYIYHPDMLRQAIYSYLQNFKTVYASDASLPQSLDDLKNYRIVIINLLYDWTNHGTDDEYNELTHEFAASSNGFEKIIPEQHKIYGLESQFNPNQYAFEWWPITMLGVSNTNGIETNMNWPNQEKFPVPRSNQFFKPMNLSYLIAGESFGATEEENAMDLSALLTKQPVDGHPLLIFYHCVAGKDRTGAVTLSYFMKHGGYANVVEPNEAGQSLTRHAPMTYVKALEAVIQHGYPKPKADALITAQAYCLSLKRTMQECVFL